MEDGILSHETRGLVEMRDGKGIKLRERPRSLRSHAATRGVVQRYDTVRDRSHRLRLTVSENPHATSTRSKRFPSGGAEGVPDLALVGMLQPCIALCRENGGIITVMPP